MNSDWSLPFRYWVLTVLAVVLAVILWSARELIEPLVIAALIAYVLKPIVDALTRHTRLSPSNAIIIVFLTGLVGLTVLTAFLWPIVLAEIQTLSADLQKIISKTPDFLIQPIVILEWEFNLTHLLPDLSNILSANVMTLPENLAHLLENVTRNLIWSLVILVSVYYLLRDWHRLRDRCFSLAPELYQPDAKKIYLEIKQVWQGYLRGNLLLMLVVWVAFTLAWFVIGLPGALILGIITGVLTIIPDLGPAIAAALAVLVALFEGSTYLPLSNFWFAVLVTGIYLGLVNIKSIWLRPRIFGRSVHMHSGVVFVAIMVAVVLQGILGALIVIPVLASGAVVGRYVYRRLLGLPPFMGSENDGDNEGEQ